MELNLKLSPKQESNLLSNFQILIDTREKKNDHITKYFDQNSYAYISKKLEFGDYSFVLPDKILFNEEEVIISGENKIVIERKADLEELSSNFSNRREAFENELSYCYDKGVKFILLIEDNKSLSSIINGNYLTNLNKNAYLGTLLSFKFRYNFDFIFCNKEHSGKIIHDLLKYYLKEHIKI